MITTAPTISSTDPSYWTDRKCASASNFLDGTLGCFGQTMSNANSVNTWTAWLWQTTLGGNEKTSGYRHSKVEPVFVAAMYKDTNNVWKGSCAQINLLNANSMLTMTTVFVAGVLTTVF